jgi:coenzyme F420-reducing hydrogenase delta subunit
VESETLPEITVFTCIYCGYTAVDMAGVTGLQFSANVKVFKLPCTGKIDALYMLTAFEQGADGVIVLACQKGTCHHLEGNLRAEKRVQRVKQVLDEIGLGGDRLEIFFLTGSQGSYYAAAVEEMAERVRRLGSNPLKATIPQPVGVPAV